MALNKPFRNQGEDGDSCSSKGHSALNMDVVKRPVSSMSSNSGQNDLATSLNHRDSIDEDSIEDLDITEELVVSNDGTGQRCHNAWDTEIHESNIAQDSVVIEEIQN